ncbi:VOC family metalloprotein YjdN [Klebsiella sp. I138]|uniref:VOC family metalloprotein YjdN n=1 Tax=Klebsiella sp. I138 TaxID=2755385 RepID=UPI003DA99127
MPLSPYITFSGNCAAAIAFYQQALGAELVHQITYGEMPQNMQDAKDGCPSGQHLSADCIAHASLRVAGSELMLGDSPSGESDGYAGFTVVLDTQELAEGKRWFDSLADGGRIEMDWQETFWAHGFGKAIDRFGVPWMVNVVKQP